MELFHAIDSGNIEAVRKAVKAGADVNIRHPETGYTPLTLAAEKEGNLYLYIVRVLLGAGADPNLQAGEERAWSTPLMAAAGNGRSEIVTSLLQAGANVNAPTPAGFTALILAADNGHLEAVRRLVNAHADVNAKNNYGWTALTGAASNGHIEVIRMLLRVGADMNIKTEASGTTALYEAVRNGHAGAVRTLLEAGADANVESNSGKAALTLAAEGGNVEIVRALLNAGVDAKGPDAKDALIDAVMNRHTEVVRALLAAGANPNTPLKSGAALLYIAGYNGDVDIGRALLDAGADPNGKGSYQNWTALHAASKKYPDMVRLLIEKGADVNARTDPGMTPLMIAVADKQIDIIRMLLDAGADVNLQVDTGQTALIFAARKGYLEIARILLEKGADVDIRDGTGETALEAASTPEMKKLLVKQWGGLSREAAAAYGAVFEDQTLSCCPICLQFQKAPPGKLYNTHNCMAFPGAVHKRLYDLYNDGGNVSWCSRCGRPSGLAGANLSHYSLSIHQNSKRGNIVPAPTGMYADIDHMCIEHGGGGFREKIARMDAMMRWLAVLQLKVDNISEKEATEQLIEETWNAPFERNPSIDTIMVTKQWTTSLYAFPSAAGVGSQDIPMAGLAIKEGGRRSKTYRKRPKTHRRTLRK